MKQMKVIVQNDATKYIYNKNKLTLLAGDGSYFSLNVKFDIVFA